MNLTALHDYWNGLAARERMLIGIGLIVLLPVGFYLYAWQPVSAERTRLSTRVVQLHGELAQLRAHAEEVKHLRAQPPIARTDTLEAVARQAALRFGLPDLKGALNAQGSDHLTVNLDSVAFDAWLRWVGELSGQGVSLTACKIEAQPGAGMVRVKAELKRSAS